MNGELRELWEHRLPEVVSAARYRLRNRLKDVSAELARRGYEPLTFDQARQWFDDVIAQAVADHWEQYCEQVATDESEAVGWLSKSRLKVTRKLAYGIVQGLQNGATDYYLSPETKAALGENQARYVELRADGNRDTAICLTLFGSDNSRNWGLLNHVRRQAELRLVLIANVARVVDKVRDCNFHLRRKLESVRGSVVSC